jgi:hypothetical protein
MNIICKWSTYKGGNCKQFVTDNAFCKKHTELMTDFLKKTDELCETYKEIKFKPRSYKHVKAMLCIYGYDDNTIQVYLDGGSIEEADITNEEFIRLESDNELFFYNPQRGQYRAKDIKIITRVYCKNTSDVKYIDKHYCETCYKELKDVPRISLVSLPKCSPVSPKHTLSNLQ